MNSYQTSPSGETEQPNEREATLLGIVQAQGFATVEWSVVSVALQHHAPIFDRIGKAADRGWPRISWNRTSPSIP